MIKPPYNSYFTKTGAHCPDQNNTYKFVIVIIIIIIIIIIACSHVQSKKQICYYCLLSQENKLKNEELPNDSKHSAVWPIWPVGLNNIHKAPLNYPKIPLPQYTPLDFSRTNRLQKNNIHIKSTPAVREEQTMQFNATTKRSNKNHARITSKYIPALTAYASSTLGLGESKHLKFTHPETKNLNEMRRLRVDLVPVKDLASVDHLRLPLIEREKTNMQSHDQPSDRKHCATGMLGVRFKTDAHKR